jgi:hypothetical protein
MTNETLCDEIIEAVESAGYRPGSVAAQRARADKLSRVREQHPDAEIVVVRDEYSGCRFAGAQRNRGRCQKLGSNSTTRGGDGSNCYQVWARWGVPS